MVSSLVCDRIQIEVALFKPGSLYNRIKTSRVLDGMQLYTAGCRADTTDRIGVATQTSPVAPSPPDQACRQTGSGIAPAALWPSGMFVEHAGG